ncbi:hypothetical protein D8674_022730 [Pyrus ussuriensis x Pyrus communis]|uniref:Uncharacterized protein n=1 Tax=Pyrus ussuriensis x Pyrus communis TaxID=2448454 RepID=A0A5N5GR54_9ROSA|nr:hypothetical protein D8674_040360 [Pyrus ussuriensis x Pyrus communis]KAB2616142.1 hypothetical protein D8674_022730 [Pyrus ussuriensis x Pyrus communis]
MEKNGNNSAASDSKGVCEKIFSAITVSPAYRAIRRAVPFPQEPKAASHASSSDAPQPQPKKSAESAPVVIQIPITSEKKNSQVKEGKHEPQNSQVGNIEDQGGLDINDRVSKYIRDTKKKFKSTPSNIGS